MKQELISLLEQLSPSNQRLLRELMWQLAQHETKTITWEHDTTLDYLAQVAPWLTHLLNQNRSPRTIKQYSDHIRHFLSSYPRPKLTHVDAFLAEATARGVKQKTLAHTISAIRSFFSYLESVDLISTNVASRVLRPHLQRSITSAPSSDNVSRILEVPKRQKHQVMLGILVDCGLRVEELVTLQVSGVDLEHRLLTVMGKGRKPRQVPLSPEVVDVVEKQIGELRSQGYAGAWLFPGRAGRDHVSTCAVWLFLDRLCHKLGLPHVSPHQLRHYFATQMLSQGASLKVTSEILGHAQVSTTANIYWHLLNQQEVVNQHSRFTPLKRTRSKLSTYQQGVFKF
jgi:integrase/recombinase XerD